ncbi:hypothetical protein ES703_91122 [subsurface metagenome]
MILVRPNQGSVRPELCARAIPPQKPSHNSLVREKELVQQAWLGAAPIRHSPQEPVLEQRRLGGKVRQHQQTVLPRLAQQVEHQIDRGALAGHVVLEIAVEALIAKVQVHSEADEQSITVESIQAKSRAEVLEAKNLALAPGSLSH